LVRTRIEGPIFAAFTDAAKRGALININFSDYITGVRVRIGSSSPLFASTSD
jgi:hypothetical protein